MNKLTGPEKKYGVNEHTELLLCPRCMCANPVQVMNSEGDNGMAILSLLCKKCLYYGHKDGALIKDIVLYNIEDLVSGKIKWSEADYQAALRREGLI